MQFSNRTASRPIESPASAPDAPGSDRVAHFTLLMDARLAAMASDSERRRALVLELAKWDRLYGQFLAMVDSPQYVPQPNEPDAFDYANLIAAISVRIGRLAPKSARVWDVP